MVRQELECGSMYKEHGGYSRACANLAWIDREKQIMRHMWAVNAGRASYLTLKLVSQDLVGYASVPARILCSSSLVA